MESSAIGQLCIGDDILVVGEVLCYLEVINRTEAYWFNDFVLRTTRNFSQSNKEANELHRRDTQVAVLVFPPDRA